MIKKMFYMSMCSGILLIFNNMSTPQNLDLSNSMQMMGSPIQMIKKAEKTLGIEIPVDAIRNFEESAAPSEETSSKDNSISHVKDEELKDYEDNATIMTVDGKEYRIIHDPYTNIDWINGHPYVTIDGQYYNYRSDNVYTINGMKVIHKTGVPGDGPTKISDMKKKNNNQIVDPDIKPGMMAVGDIKSIGDVMKVISNAKARLVQRDQALEKIMDDM